MKNLNLLLNLVGREKSYKQARRSRGSLDSIVSRFCLASLICTLLLTVGVGNARADSQSFDKDDFSSSTSSTKTPITVTFSAKSISGQQIRFNSGTTVTFTSSSGNITSIAVATNSTNQYIRDMGATVSSGTWSGSGTSYSWSGNASSITMTAGAACRITTITVTYTAASCTANPTVGDASLNGSISLSSIPLSVASVGGGSDCTLSDYGFVWKSGSAPSASDNKTSIGTSSSATDFTGSITGTFALGTTYYIKAYATNDGSNTTLSTNSLQVTPRSVTFDLNGHGSSTPSTQYVNNGGKATDPEYSESVSGYTFGGWYKETGCSNAWDFSTDAVSGGNKTLYAKWTVKTAYTVTFNEGTGSCGTSSLTEASADAGVELPTATHACPGWSFAGWATASVATSTSVKPTLYAAGDTYHPAGNETLYAVYKQASGGGGTNTITIIPDDFPSKGSNSYGSGAERNATVSTINFGAHYVTGNAANSPVNPCSAGTYLQCQKNNANIYNKTALSGVITTVVVNQYGDASWSLYCGTSQLMASDNTSTEQTPTGTQITDVSAATTMTWDNIDASGSYTHFDLKKTGTGTGYITSIVVTYSTISYNYYSEPTCAGASLSVTPTTYNYGTQSLDSETEAFFTVAGINLTADATLALSGANDGMFILSTTTLEEDGGRIDGADNVTIIYHPTASGTHTATLTISSTGAADATVTLNGKCELVCSQPTVSFTDGETIYKYQGDAPFTNLARVNGNGLNAAVTYSSNNTSVATVHPTTGEVTIVNASDGDAVRITVSVEAKENDAHTACQNAVSRYYNLIVKNRVTWMVNNEEYTEGDPTPSVYEDGTIGALPTPPDGSSLCGGKTFVGWTDATGGAYTHGTSNLYKTAGEIPAISDNKVFYAVFAEASAGGEPTLTKMAKGDTFSDGDKIVIVAHGTTVALYQETTNSSYVAKWTFDNDVATVEADDKKWLTVTATEGGWYLGDATNGYINHSDNNLYCDGDQSIWTLTDRNDGTFNIISSTGRYLAYRSDLAAANQYWRGGGTAGTNGVSVLDIYKYTEDGTSYSDYTTECGVCLKAPNPITVTATRISATLSWKAVADATGYEVTCAQGGTPIDPANIAVDGTTATITGLSATTTYTYSVRSIGSEETYDCFPPKNGSFTTPDCDDVPVIGTTTVTALTATLTWTCSAATSTIKLYSDAACTQNETEFASKTSPAELTGLVSDSTYYFKIFAGGTCASQVGSFKTEDVALDISEWRNDAVVITYNGEADLTLTTYNEVAHGSKDSHVATELFFSKYFEAAAGVKMLAIYNGTTEQKDLSSYKLCVAQNQNAFKETAFSSFIKKDGNSLTTAEKILEPNEEVIFISFEENANYGNDTTIIACARDNDEQSGYSSYIRIKTPELAFNGDDVIGLKNPSGNFIDMIGPQNHNKTNFTSCSGVGGTGCDFMDNPGGWYNENGYYANPDGTETPNYALATNRCLLIRRKHVTSGDSAVARNIDDFVTLGDYIYDGKSHEGEWKGVQIPGTTTPEPGQARKDIPGIKAACEGFMEVGGFDYNDYYTSYEAFGESQTFEDLKSKTDPWDGTYIIPVNKLDTMACTKVRIELANDEDKVVIRKDIQVPIMVYGDKLTNDAIFNNYHKGPAVCKNCDVVVMSSASLTKFEGSAPATDAVEVRDVKVYQGGKLIVPEDYTYTVNSLAFRRLEDEISMADIQGTLNVNKLDGKGVYLDLRIDPSQWHFVALPFDCNVEDISFSDGTPAVHREDYFIKWYNGATRAANKDGGWETYTGAVLKKGLGYRIGLAGNGVVKRELRFPMSNGVIDDEQADTKTVGKVYAYGGDKTDAQLTPNHKGWNLIGNPYLMYYATDITTPLGLDSLQPDGNTYKRYENGVRYLVEPINNGAGGYKQIPISTHMPPFTSYFVQIGTAANKNGGDDPTTGHDVIYNKSSAGKSNVIARRKYAEVKEDSHPVWYGIEIVAPNGERDQTTLLISNDFTDSYDMMDDLIKMRGSKYTRYNRPVLASRNAKEELAFNALPDNSAAVVGVPLNYYAAQAGTYRIQTDGKYGLEEVKSAMLYDVTTNQYYDLLANNYEFTTAKGDNTNRFKLFVRVERDKTPEIATDNDNVLADGELSLVTIGHTLVLSGITREADVYVYDMSGKLMSSSHTAGNSVWRATVPAQGVYFVRVNSAAGQQTLRTIVK